MKFNFHGIPYDKLLTSFFGLYVGVALMKSADKKTIQRYDKKMDANTEAPSNALEALAVCIFGKKPNETFVDKYTGIKLWKAGKSFVSQRTKKLLNIKDAKPGVFWESIMVMQSRFSINNSHIQEIKKAILLWDKLDSDEKQEAVNAAYQMVILSDVDNKLEMEMHDLNNELLLKTSVDGTYSLGGYAKRFLKKINVLPIPVKEDEETAGIQDSTVQSTGDIAHKSGKLMGGKLIKRKVKKFKSIKYKDPRKISCNQDSTNEEE